MNDRLNTPSYWRFTDDQARSRVCHENRSPVKKGCRRNWWIGRRDCSSFARYPGFDSANQRLTGYRCNIGHSLPAAIATCTTLGGRQWQICTGGAFSVIRKRFVRHYPWPARHWYTARSDGHSPRSTGGPDVASSSTGIKGIGRTSGKRGLLGEAWVFRRKEAIMRSSRHWMLSEMITKWWATWGFGLIHFTSDNGHIDDRSQI